MKLIFSCLIVLLVMLWAGHSYATTRQVQLTFPGTFSPKEAAVFAQQIFTNLSSDNIGALDPGSSTNNALPFSYKITSDPSLVFTFTVIVP